MTTTTVFAENFSATSRADELCETPGWNVTDQEPAIHMLVDGYKTLREWQSQSEQPYGINYLCFRRSSKANNLMREYMRAMLPYRLEPQGGEYISVVNREYKPLGVRNYGPFIKNRARFPQFLVPCYMIHLGAATKMNAGEDTEAVCLYMGSTSPWTSKAHFNAYVINLAKLLVGADDQ